MNALSDLLGRLPPTAACAVVALAVLAESILLVGAFVPTLTLLLTAGALARAGHIGLPLVVAVAAGAVVAGDFLAHRTGALLGDRLRGGRVGRRIPGAAWQRAETLMTRHGGRAVFLARFLPVVRTLAPHFAGATRLPYRRIAPYSVAAACLWAAAEVGVGYAAAAPLQRILTLGGPAVALVVLSAVGAALLRRRSVLRARRAAAARPPVPLTRAPASAPPRSSCPGPSAGCPSAE
ncbi:DedA family protein [Streptomyces sp. NPDC051677]|uniref:DedA family protein n=1 Tax=Streptomyces sp. NPDC051677 TaxID=3365669 RepID=UPI0037D8DDFF